MEWIREAGGRGDLRKRQHIQIRRDSVCDILREERYRCVANTVPSTEKPTAVRSCSESALPHPSRGR